MLYTQVLTTALDRSAIPHLILGGPQDGTIGQFLTGTAPAIVKLEGGFYLRRFLTPRAVVYEWNPYNPPAPSRWLSKSRGRVDFSKRTRLESTHFGRKPQDRG